MNRDIKRENVDFYVKICAFCGKTFYAKKKSAVYCSNTCRQKFYIRKTTTPQWYNHDPNEGKKLPPGTVTSWEMPEDKMAFQGNKVALFQKLSEKLTKEKLLGEKEYIENLKPFCQTSEWTESSAQIFTDINFIEVFRISPDMYKLYVNPWGAHNEKPFR
jgi:hypothetical protein